MTYRAVLFLSYALLAISLYIMATTNALLSRNCAKMHHEIGAWGFTVPVCDEWRKR